MDICILSSGRAGRQATWSALPAAIQAKTKIVIPAGEEHHYAKFPHISVPVKGIGPTRQWVIDNCSDKVVMLDNDLTFAVRRGDNPAKFVPATDKDVEDMFNTIWGLLDKYAHVGVAGREGGNRVISRFIHTTRMIRILAYDARVLRKAKVRFDALEVMEDFHTTLRLLRLGFDNILLNHIVHNQYGSNTAGGCSQYRTPEMQELAANLLKEHHPDFVKVVKKQTKVAWGGMRERSDVIIQWKRAFQADI